MCSRVYGPWQCCESRFQSPQYPQGYKGEASCRPPRNCVAFSRQADKTIWASTYGALMTSAVRGGLKMSWTFQISIKFWWKGEVVSKIKNFCRHHKCVSPSNDAVVCFSLVISGSTTHAHAHGQCPGSGPLPDADAGCPGARRQPSYDHPTNVKIIEGDKGGECPLKSKYPRTPALCPHSLPPSPMP